MKQLQVLRALVLVSLLMCTGYGTAANSATKSASVLIATEILLEKDVQIETRDGSSIVADVYRPSRGGKYPVILFMSPYGKDIHVRDFKPHAWDDMQQRIPGLLANSSGEYHTWETYDPEVWVSHGYVIIRIDSRGSGKSPGHIDVLSRKQAEDYYDAIEWAADQAWSTGKVGMAGISYFSAIQWLTASLQPPHLDGFIAWEGLSDRYREFQRHGGILENTFSSLWWQNQVVATQHRSDTGAGQDLVSPPSPLTDEQLSALRTIPLEMGLKHPLYDAYNHTYSVDFSKITVPFLSAANWGGLGLHLRGNVEGYVRSASKQKWLSTHGGNHYVPFFSEDGQALQKAFFDHFLKGMENGWSGRPPILLSVRHPGEVYKQRAEQDWPLPSTLWTKLYLDSSNMSLANVSPQQKSSVSYHATEQAAVFQTRPFEHATEITGPLKLRAWVESSTEDMDIFATLQLFDPNDVEVTFEGASEPAVPITQGWLRASRRKLDEDLSTEYRPFHSHDTEQLLVPGSVYEVQVELWPTSIVVPAGYSLVLRLEGKDFSRSSTGGLRTGSGLFLHSDATDRPMDIFAGNNVIHTGGAYESYILLPVIPETDKPNHE